MTVESPELPEAPNGTNTVYDVDEISENLGNVITEYLTEQANCIWIDTANERIKDLPKEDDIRKAMIQELDRHITPTDWYDEAVDCINEWMLDDSLLHYGEECTIEEGY